MNKVFKLLMRDCAVAKRFVVLAIWCWLLGVSVVNAQRYVGGDVSLLPSYEENGSVFLDNAGRTIDDVLTFSRDNGLNVMRVRLFVEPQNASSKDRGEGVRQDLDYVVSLGRRIKEAGMAFMLDFHYSDTWADPGKQWTPRGWLALSDEELYGTIYDYTAGMLLTLSDAGAAPDFIQTGNEISYGMLWGAEGAVSLKKCYYGNQANWARFTSLLKQASRACRDVCPDAKIILHTERVAATDVLANFYEQMREADVDYDVIGISYYPYYHGTLSALDNALGMLEAQFSDKSIMIVETGYFYNWQPTVKSPGADLSATYPVSESGQQAFTKDLISILLKHDNVTGLVWWWMEANEYGHTGVQQVTTDWYNASLWNDQTGRVTPAFYELRDFLGKESEGLPIVESDKGMPVHWYSANGMPASPVGRGLYVSNNGKIVLE